MIITKNMDDYVIRLNRLCAVLRGADPTEIGPLFRGWYNNELHQVASWREAMNWCTLRAQMGLPMPWDSSYEQCQRALTLTNVEEKC